MRPQNRHESVFLSPPDSVLSDMATLTIDQLTHRFGHQTVIRNLSLESSVSILGISGANGSGKSTLMKCLAGLLKPTTGSIEWHLRSEICSGLDALGKIGFAAPYVELYETLTLQENLRFLLDLHRGETPNRDESPTSIADLLIRFQAESFADQLYGDLSTGQRQRAKLAAAVLRRPEILCLDEPGANLDEEGRTLVQSTINRFTEEGKMVLIASNQPGELALCQQTIDLDTHSNLNTHSDTG